MSSAGARRPVRSLHLLASTDRRGAESFALELAEHLIGAGRDAELVALVAGRTGGIDVPVLGRRRFSPGTLLGLRRRASRAGVVVGHGSSTLAAGALATPGTGARFVYRNIGDPLFWASTPLRRARVRWFLTRADSVVALWPGSAEALVSRFGVPVEKVVVIANGRSAELFPIVDPERRVAARQALGLAGAPVVAYLGSLSREKRVDLAIGAVARIDGVTLLVAGDGALRPALEQQAVSEAPGRVRFLGSVPDTSRVLAASDAVVLTSDSEGLPAVLIEAGLSGLPVVATDVGGVSEIVDDGVTGILVSPGDASAVTEALGRVLDDPGPMGAAAHRRCVERFEMGQIGRQWDDLLTRLGAGR